MTSERVANAPGRAVTLVIHGTFAADEDWWRLAQAGSQGETFADRLERALTARGLPGTVWAPALRLGFDYDRFAWSGRNRHADRRAAARKLAQSIDELAAATGATQDDPLRVNLVAHSHGGNVALEALKHLGPTVELGRVVLLGTPLLSRTPSLRFFRFALAAMMALMLLAFAIYIPFIAFCAGCDVLGGCSACNMGGGKELPWTIVTIGLIPAAAMYGWLFTGMAALMDAVWRGLVQLGTFFRFHPQLYGPRLSLLRKRRGAAPILLLTSHDDEAGLLLQIGAAPELLYRARVHRFGRIGRVAERLVLRAIVAGLLLRAAEVVLERFVLGIGWWHTLFLDCELVDPGNKAKVYPPDVIENVDLSSHLSLSTVRARRERPPLLQPPQGTSPLVTTGAPASSTQANVPVDLLETLDSVRSYLVSQVKLRHSLYYEDDGALERIADAIIATVPNATSPAAPGSSLAAAG